jgi:hypothetical protein
MQSACPGGGGEGAGVGTPEVRPPSSGLLSHREDIILETASLFREIPVWRLHPIVFQRIAAGWGLPEIDLFASNASKQTKCFYSWNAFNNPEGVDSFSQR